MAQAEAHAAAVPWSERLATANPFATAVGVAAILVAVFLSLSFWVGGLPALLGDDAPLHIRQDVRIGIVFSLVAAYLPAAWVSAVRGARRSVTELEPWLRGSPAEHALLEDVGHYASGTLRAAGLIGIVSGIAIQLFTDWGDGPDLVLLGLTFETYWHRVMLFAIAWMLGRSIYATLVETRRFSRIGRDFVAIDLLDSRPQEILARRSLHTALLVIGALSLFSLMFFDVAAAPQLGLTLAVLGLGSVILAGLVLWLPLRGLHDAVAEAKRSELTWCNQAIRRARESTAAGPRSLADLVAYRGLIESVREWPLDAPALRRFALYLVIPLASWLGGALVERLVDTLID